VKLGAVWATGKRPVGNGEGVLDLSARLSVASEEAGSEGIGLGSEGIDGDGPADSPGQAVHLFSEKRGANRAGDVEGAGTGEVINAFLYESAAGRMQVQRVAADATLEAARAHGALLQESGREAAFAKGREGTDSVVAEDHHGVR
jgi:hypothetical protein